MYRFGEFLVYKHIGFLKRPLRDYLGIFIHTVEELIPIISSIPN